jgi:hypothetical protein
MSFVQNSAGQCLVEVGSMASARPAPNPMDVKYSAWGSPMEQGRRRTHLRYLSELNFRVPCHSLPLFERIGQEAFRPGSQKRIRWIS